MIAAEDTRRTGKLLNHYDVEVPLLSYFEHNEAKRIPQIVERLKGGENIALVTDSGTPGISDPAYRLIRECLKHGIEVTTVPGPSAVTAAAVLSGLPTDRFIFEGFLPKKKGRRSRISELAQEERTVIIFESPERVKRTLAECRREMGDRPVSVCRELTKMHEEVYRGKLSDAEIHFSEKRPRGEIVLVIGKDDPNVYFDWDEPLEKGV